MSSNPGGSTSDNDWEPEQDPNQGMAAALAWDVPLLGQHLHFALKQRSGTEQLGNFCSMTDQRNCSLNMQRMELDEVSFC